MKKMFIVALVILGLLGVAGAATAQDWSISVDYSQLSLGTYQNNDPKIFTFEAEYTPGNLIFGFTDSALIVYRDLPSGTKEDYGMVGIYAGYNFIKNDAGSFGLAVSDLNWGFSEKNGVSSDKYVIDSVGIGPVAKVNLGNAKISFAYFYGLNNRQTHTANGAKTKDDGVSVNYFEVKTDMALSDTMGLCLAYRHSDLDFVSPSNIGVGINWNF